MDGDTRSTHLELLVCDLRDGCISRREFVQRGLRLGLGVSALGMLLGAGAETSAASSDSRRAGVAAGAATTLVAGVASAPGKFDPHGWGGFTSNIVTNHVFQGLVRLNFDTSEIEPALASKWEQPDKKTWIYHLRQGATFHDGSPVTAADVVFSVKRAKKVSWGTYGLANMASVRAIDPHTVEVKLTHPDWRFKWFFYWPPGSILSKKYFDKVGENTATQKPIGTNAFMLSSASSSEVVMKKFPKYWEHGLPYLDQVKLQVLDPTTIVSGLKTGEIHLSPDVGFDSLKLVGGFGNLNVHARVGPHIVETYLNMTKPPFDDVKVRRAVAEALDNAAALSAYPANYYQPSKGAWIHPSFKYSIFKETNAVYTSDLNKAKQMLAASSQPNGFTADWTVAADRPQELSAALGAQERLAKIGIKINLKQLPDAEVGAATYARPRPWSIITYNWLHNEPNALDPIAALVSSAEAGTNFPSFKNAEYDKLVAQASITSDTKLLAAKLRRLQQIHIDQVPLLVHGWDGIRRVESNKLQTPKQTILAEWDDWFRTTKFTA
jgi:peptide/nickel transport system substrate-binding protein